jgi:hypothetical protein
MHRLKYSTYDCRLQRTAFDTMDNDPMAAHYNFSFWGKNYTFRGEKIIYNIKMCSDWHKMVKCKLM